MAVQGHANQNDFQAMAVASGIDEASLCWLLPFCSKQLGLQGLACLAASSRGLRTACHSIVQTEAASLVIAEFGTAEAGISTDRYGKTVIKQRHVQGAAWALHLAPTAATAAEVAEQLICLPVRCAGKLLDAGVRISYDQVLAAANNMVPGVELWLYLQHERIQLQADSDIPAAAVAICFPPRQLHELHQLLVSTDNSFVSVSLHFEGGVALARVRYTQQQAYAGVCCADSELNA
jgi:hypothetical protein